MFFRKDCDVETKCYSEMANECLTDEASYSSPLRTRDCELSLQRATTHCPCMAVTVREQVRILDWSGYDETSLECSGMLGSRPPSGFAL